MRIWLINDGNLFAQDPNRKPFVSLKEDSDDETAVEYALPVLNQRSAYRMRADRNKSTVNAIFIVFLHNNNYYL